MKNSTSKNSHDNSSRIEKEGSENCKNQNKLPPKAVTSTMTDQLIVPPARVWDKIEKILDEQDNRRNDADKIIASSFSRTHFFKKKRFYFATIAGLSVVAGLFWAMH